MLEVWNPHGNFVPCPLCRYRFLGSAIELVHVLLKMLERYSKSKRFMFIRKKKATPKKNKASGKLSRNIYLLSVHPNFNVTFENALTY